jgi:glycosyltransferase involved in cell wall biosynthesis
MLSRLNRLKGGEYFVEAAAAVAARHSGVRFLIVGDVGGGEKAYKAQLEQQARRLGIADRVIFTGFRMDVRELLAETTVSVLPSLSEGLSNVLLESMAVGVPVIGTTVGGTPEIIEDGVTGFLIPPRDAESLARAMCRLIEDPQRARAMGLAGRRRIAEHFGIGRMVRQTEQHYVRMLERATIRPEHGAMEVRA